MIAFFKFIFSGIKGIILSWRILVKVVIAIACAILVWYIFSKLNIMSSIKYVLKSVFDGVMGVFSFIKGLSPL